MPSDAVRADTGGIAELGRLLADGGVFVLSGAGVSTASGIPDYRDADGAWKGPQPVQYRDFVGSEATRQRYWARSMVGFRLLTNAEPNLGHRALSRLEERGMLSLLVTQNVDGLHRRAGSKSVIDLHGRLDQVVCLGCTAITSRARLQSQLELHNRQFLSATATVKPDGDAELEAVRYENFELVDCADCGGMLKPDVVFFGENVLGLPIAIVNRGKTRADDIAALKVSGDIAHVLGELAGLSLR
jgi:NAD-dependent SIR2 family protein deacetylase